MRKLKRTPNASDMTIKAWDVDGERIMVGLKFIGKNARQKY